MTTSHTPETWTLGDRHEVCSISDQLNHGYMIADCHGPEKEPNARRIVACVNVCAGLPTDFLEKKLFGEAISETFDQLKQQNADLLAALKTIISFDGAKYGVAFDMKGVARKAIAKAGAQL